MITLKDIQSYLSAHDADGWLLYHFRDQNPIALSVAGIERGGSRRWFLWIPTVGRPVWIAHSIERSNFRDLPEDLRGEVRLYVSWQDLAKALTDSVRTASGPAKRILMEYSPQNSNPYVSRVDAGVMELVSQATGVTIESSADLVQLAAAIIEPEHVEQHKEAARICESIKECAFELIADRLRAGRTITEYEAQQFIADQFAAAGLKPARSIVAVNGNAADPHYFPSEKLHAPIRRGDAVLIDLWNRLEGDPDACVADITWTAFCGETVPPKVESIFQIVKEARDTAVDYMQRRLSAGETVFGYEVDDACRSVIDGAGYGEAFFHRTGHSLGPTGHFIGVNIDNLETQDRRSLLPGVMFSIEPGIYLPDYDFDDSGESKGLGIRSEIDCYVHPDGVEVTTLPIQTEIRPLLA
jgi:Xaa-Pro aminopeptidase